MAGIEPVTLYESAEDEQLREIIRQAEIRLDEQGEVIRANEQKAVQLTGLFGTLAAAGFPVSAQAWQNHFDALAAGAFAGSLICFGCSVLTVAACFPERFGVMGNDPGNWLEDLLEKKTQKRSLAETADNYDKALKRNRARMSRRRFLLIAALILFCLAAPVGLVAAVASASAQTPMPMPSPATEGL